MSGNDDSKPRKEYLSERERQARIYGTYEHTRTVGDHEISYTVPHTAMYEPASMWRGTATAPRARRGRVQPRGSYGGHSFWPPMQGYRDVPVVDPVQGALYSFDTPQNTPPPAMNPHSHAFPSTAPTTTTSAGYYPGSDRDNRLTYDTGRSVGPPTASPQSAQRNTQLFLPSPTSSPPPASAPVREDEDDGAGTQAGPSHSSPTSSSGLTIRIPPSSYRGKGKERERSHIHVRRAKKDKEEDESE